MTPLYAIFDTNHLGADLDIEQAGTVIAVNAIADINRTVLALFPQSVGVWDAELLVYGPGDLLASIGIATLDAALDTYAGGDAEGYGYRMDLGEIHHAGASVASVAVGAVGDMVRLRLDLTTTQPTVSWYRNGQLLHTQALASTGPWAIAVSLGGSEAYGLRVFLNSGQRKIETGAADSEGWFQPPQSVRGLQLGSDDWMTAPTDAVANQRYNGLLSGTDSELRAIQALDFWPWARGIRTGAMVLTALDTDGLFDEILSGDPRDLSVRVGQIDVGQAYADRASLYNAVIDNVAPADDLTVKITCRGPEALLDVPLQRWLLRPDADPSSANQPRPLLLGACRNVPAVLVDATTYAYAVSDATILGVGFGRDRGYPFDPAAAPPDFTLDSTKLGIVLHAEPQGIVTIDASSVGGQQLPTPADDILDGAGAPFTGDDGDAPNGFETGGDLPQATPVMNSGALEFPLVQVAPTILATMRAYASGAAGSVALRLSWLDDGGNVVRQIDSAAITGSHAWTDAVATVIDTAPATAISGRLEAVTHNHTAGTVRVSTPQAWYVQYGDHDAIGLLNPDFVDGLANWTSTAAWEAIDDFGPGGHCVKYSGAAGSRRTNEGVAPVTPGQRISASCQIALDKPDGTHPYGALRITWLDADDGEIDSSRSASEEIGHGGAFRLVTVSGTAPAGAVTAVIELEGGNAGSGTAGALFGAVQWDFVLEPVGGTRIAIILPDLTHAADWQAGANWALHPAGANGYLGAAYGEHTAAAAGSAAASSSLLSRRAANVRQAVSYAGWAGISAAQIGAGKSYKVRITIDAMPADGFTYVGLATGTTIDTLLASWNKAGTYEVTITNTDGVAHDLYLLSIPLSAGGSIVPVAPVVSSLEVMTYDDTYTPDPRDITPALLQSIKLADYLHQVLDVRAQALGMAWSRDDAAAIDTATGYAGIGVFLRGGETVRQALDLALASYTACPWTDEDGVLRISRLIDPDDIEPVGTIDINAISGDLLPQLDLAPGLTTQFGVRRNWAAFSDGDLVSPSDNFPLAVRQSLLRPYQVLASTAQPLASAYTHALYAAPVVSCFDALPDGQAEIDRVAKIYGKPRRFFSVSVELEALPGLKLGQVWTLVYPKYGLASGLRVLIAERDVDLLANTANLIVWG
jgi:hypothetical protein